MSTEHLTPQRINLVRGAMTWCVRGVAVLLVAVGAYLVLKRLAFGVGVWDFETALRVWEGIGEEQSFYRGVAMVLVGGGLGAFSRRISGWVIAMPPTGCPQCGYAVAPPDGGAWPGKCPECGLRLEHGSDERTPRPS